MILSRLQNFTFTGTPKILFGAGEIDRLPEIIRGRHNRVLLLTGSKSFRSSAHWDKLIKNLKESGICHSDYVMSGEPSPNHVDNVVSACAYKKFDWVVAIGGGSVIDAGKAVSAMLPLKAPVFDYLEGVGTKNHPGVKVPFIAVPTTAGTGSEATNNAVISRIGDHGFKKSLRHDNFIPDIAVIDPRLMITCPPKVTAFCGLDAFTQLLESYVSTHATEMTDALAYTGMQAIKNTLIQAATTGSQDISVRSGMAYAALISGISLTNAGLGIVHGLASTVGGFFQIPHGAFCGTMIAEATEMTIKKLRAQGSTNITSLKKYMDIGQLLGDSKNMDGERSCYVLVDALHKWTEKLAPPRLGKFGINDSHLEKIANAASNKNNPVQLTKSEIKDLLKRRL